MRVLLSIGECNRVVAMCVHVKPFVFTVFHGMVTDRFCRSEVFE